MQYASVIVNHPTAFDKLTYSIPAALLAQLAVGSIVRAPYSHTFVHGIVVGFTKQAPKGLAGKIRPLKSLVAQGASISSSILQATEELHHRYGISRGEILFSLLPPLPIRPFTQASPPEVGSPHRRGFTFQTYQAGPIQRLRLYAQFAQAAEARGQSLLIICPSQATKHALARELRKTAPVHSVVYPDNPTPRQQRHHFFQPYDRSSVIIGTRGALRTPLHGISAICIDEPWLPGHKDDSSPRFWSAMTAYALCQAEKISLIFLTTTPWPETALIDHATEEIQPTPLGQVAYWPRRPLDETVTHFVSSPESPPGAIVVHEQKREIIWCSVCRQESVGELCPRCATATRTLPRLTTEMIAETLPSDFKNVPILTPDQIITCRPMGRILALNFDVFLSLSDFRAPFYLLNILHILRAQTSVVQFVTNHPLEWESLDRSDVTTFLRHTLAQRKKEQLPPFGLPIQFLSKTSQPLEELLKDDLNGHMLHVGKIHHRGTFFTLSALIDHRRPVPVAWHKKSQIKIDILPHYIQS